MPSLSTTALVSAGNLREWLGTDPSDDIINFIGNAVSREIEENFLHRHIVSQSFGELYDPPAARELILNEPDVSAVGLIGVETESGLTVKYTGTDTHARAEVTDTSVVTVSRVGATSTSTTSTFAANVTTAAMATTIDALSGWDATVVNSRPSAYLVRQGSRNAKNITLDLEVWAEYDGEYETDYKAGILTLDTCWQAVADRGQVYVNYTAGLVSAISSASDVELVALEMCKAAYERSQRDTSLQSESLGDYSYTIQQASVPSVESNDSWVSRLNRYRRRLV